MTLAQQSIRMGHCSDDATPFIKTLETQQTQTNRNQRTTPPVKRGSLLRKIHANRQDVTRANHQLNFRKMLAIKKSTDGKDLGREGGKPTYKILKLFCSKPFLRSHLIGSKESLINPC